MNFIRLTPILLLCAQIVFGNAIDQWKSKDLDTYTKEELEILVKFRARVKNDLTQEYMSQNKYLIRFLRARKLDLKEAEIMMRENFRWRKKFAVDGIIHKNYTNAKLVRRFPFHFTLTHDGRPTIASGLRYIDVRQLLISGDLDEMREYVIYAIERAVWNIHLKAHEYEREIIEGVLLFNMFGFNLRLHACLGCMQLWIEIADSYERYYPQLGHKIIVINTPRVFQTVFNILKPFMTGHTLKATYLYTVDKSEWGPVLHELYPKERLTAEFGGTAPPQVPYTLSREQYEAQLGHSYKSTLTRERDQQRGQ